MNAALRFAAALLCAAALVLPASAQDKEKDIFNYVAQKAAGKDVKKIVFIADAGTHGGKGNHEFKAGAIFLARTLNEKYPNCYATVHLNTRWPKDLSFADAVVVLLNHGRKAATDPEIKSAVERGAGFMAIHFGVEVEKGIQGDNYLKWMGGYFEQFWSVNPTWKANIDKIPEHEITRGVKPFTLNDEWYYHMRFVPDMKGVTPILSAVPDVKTITNRWKGPKASGYDGNPTVLEAVKAGRAASRLGLCPSRWRPRLRLHRLSLLRQSQGRQLPHAALERNRLDHEARSAREWHPNQDDRRADGAALSGRAADVAEVIDLPRRLRFRSRVPWNESARQDQRMRSRKR